MCAKVFEQPFLIRWSEPEYMCGKYQKYKIDCPSTTWGDPNTRICVSTCPVNTYYQIYGLARICVARCYPNYYADLNRTCVAAASCPTSPVFYYGDDSTNLCVKNCPAGLGYYAEPATHKCVYFCTLGTFGDP